MKIIQFGETDAKELCKWLWILSSLFVLLELQFSSLNYFEGIDWYHAAKFHVMIFYFTYLKPILIIIVIKFIFELIYSFYKKIGVSQE